MAASATSLEYVQKMFLAYFGRPVAPTGQEYYAQLVDAGNIAALQDDFWNSAESQAKFGSLTTEGKVNAIFNQLFGRDAAVSGLTYWTTEINAGRVSLPVAALTILNSASAADLEVFNAKLDVANAFTAELDTTAEILAYQSNLDAAVALLAGVKTAADADAVIADISNAVADVVAGGTTNPGQTFTLTAGVDTITGTAGNDTFTSNPTKADGSDATTLNAFDVLNGGAGTDTLNITANKVSTTNYNNALTGTISGIEIINLDLTAADAPSSVDASVGGAELQQLWQISKAADVSKLAATTTAGFRKVALTSTADLDVVAADGASSVTVALDQVGGDSSSGVTTADLDIDGANLGSVVVSGTIKASDTAGKDTTKLALNVDAGVDASGNNLKTLTVNTNQTTTLAVTTGGSTSAVTTIDASASTGGITFQKSASAATVTSSITTGSGKDDVTLYAAVVKDNAATSTDETVSGYINTGAGDDTITAKFAGGTITSTGVATVLAGEGNDTVTITGLAGGGTTVDGGAGDDRIDVSGVTLTTKDKIIGGDGTDTLVIAGGTSLVTADYLTISAVASGFEVLEADTATTIDASQVNAQFTKLAFSVSGTSTTAITNTVNKVGTQSLELTGAYTNLTANTAGYVAATSTVAATYAGTLNVTSKSADAALALSAEAANVAIVTSSKDDASTTADTNTTLANTVSGDLKTLSVDLTSTREVTAAGKSTGQENLAKITVDLDPNTESTTANTTLQALTSVTVKGAGIVVVDATDTTGTTEGTTDAVSGKLTTIDLSGMTAFLNLDANGDQVTGSGFGYKNLSTSTVTLNNAVAETVKLGGADDTVVTASTYAKMDTIEGFELVASATDTTGKTADAAKSDSIVLSFAGSETAWTSFKFDATPANLSAALLEVGNASAANILFNFDGNTYIYQDDSTAGISANDTLIKLVGTYNLDLLNDVVVAPV